MQSLTTIMLTITLAASACGPTDQNDDASNIPTKPGPAVVASFDGASWFLPESVAYHDELAYMSFLNGAVSTVDAEGSVTEFGYVAIDPPGSAYGLGVSVGADGTVFLAMAKASATSAFPAGIYAIAPSGGPGELLASHPELYIPNDVDSDDAGNLYITADGRIYKFEGTTPGVADVWAEGSLLASSDGSADAPCGARTSPFPIGANGIEVAGGRVVVGNTESGALVEIEILADGEAGSIAPLVSNPAELCGIDGLVGDADGSFLATVLGSSLARISRDGATIQTVHAGSPFLTPAGVDVGTFGGRRQALVASPDFGAAFGPDGPASASPALTSVPLD